MSSRELLPALENEAEHRGEHEEQGEDREESEVSDQGRVAAAAVLAEPLDRVDRYVGSPGSGAQRFHPGELGPSHT